MTFAMVFPGQGSQSSGMQAELAVAWPQVQETYAEASNRLDYDLWSLVQSDNADALNQTEVTQPAMLTAGVAAWRCWQAAGGSMPSYTAGHSLGEYTALVVAGALEFADAVLLVRQRAQFMQAAVPAGSCAMAAVLGLDDATVEQVCAAAEQGDVVSAVNFNSPGQVVIAGTSGAVERAIEAAKEAGARRAMLLSVSVPSHCALMQPAADEMSAALEQATIAEPQLPVIGNADVVPYTDAAGIRDGLRRQLFSPVRWVETVQFMQAQGVDRIVECGPGKVLAGLTKRIDRAITGLCVDTPDTLQKALADN